MTLSDFDRVEIDPGGGGASWSCEGCVFPFEVEVPRGLDFYAVEVGRRGKLTYSREELEAHDWNVGLELGG